MKQLNEQILEPENIVLAKQNETKKQANYVGSFRIHKGQKMFELNTITAKVSEVDFKETEIRLNGEIRKKLTMKEGYWYEAAINKKNAERKFLKRLKSIVTK